MRRAARRRHALVWLVLGPAVLIGLAVALASRPPLAVSDGLVPVAEDESRGAP